MIQTRGLLTGSGVQDHCVSHPWRGCDQQSLQTAHLEDKVMVPHPEAGGLRDV